MAHVAADGAPGTKEERCTGSQLLAGERFAVNSIDAVYAVHWNILLLKVLQQLVPSFRISFQINGTDDSISRM
jgi:hypothetical protein